jgi:subtilisin-like proprotein convertase family protein
MKSLITFSVFALAASSLAVTYTGAGFTLADGTSTAVGVASSDITVTDTGTVGSINSVTLTNLTHTWLGDLEIRLTNVASGTSVILASPPDLRSANFNGTYTFAVGTQYQTIDEASLNQASTYNVPTGTYAISSYGGGTNVGARTSYSALTGLPLAGQWRLEISDFAPGDTGALGSWSLNATPQAVPEPATMAALGLGAAAMLRRRKKA